MDGFAKDASSLVICQNTKTASCVCLFFMFPCSAAVDVFTCSELIFSFRLFVLKKYQKQNKVSKISDGLILDSA